MVATSCSLCGQAPALRFRISDYDIVRCERRDLEWVDPMPNPEEIAAV